jgi:hypothetical protein
MKRIRAAFVWALALLELCPGSTANPRRYVATK